MQIDLGFMEIVVLKSLLQMNIERYESYDKLDKQEKAILNASKKTLEKLNVIQ